MEGTRKQCLPHSRTDTWEVRGCGSVHRAKPAGIPVLRGRIQHELPSLAKEVSPTDPLPKEKLVFSEGASVVVLATL